MRVDEVVIFVGKGNKEPLKDASVEVDDVFFLIIFLWQQGHKSVILFSGKAAHLRWQTEAGLAEPENHVVRVVTDIAFNVGIEETTDTYDKRQLTK